MPHGTPAPPAGGEDRSARRLALQTAAGALGLFGAVAFGALVFRAQLESLGAAFVGRFGVAGAWVGTLLADSIGFPIPPDAYLVAAVLGDAEPVTLLAGVCAASVVGGNAAYGIGWMANRWGWLQRRIGWLRKRGDRVFARWGWAAVALAAWTPIPFSVVCTLAGVFRMPYRQFALHTLHRVPRMVAYYGLIVVGWGVGQWTG